MLRIFDYQDYKKYINDYIKTLPQNGRGQYHKMAKVLNTSTSLISQIFKSDREMTMEQGYLLANYLKLDLPETRYFITMLSLAKAGNYKLKTFFSSELKLQKKEADKLNQRLKVNQILKDEEMAIFYSDALYSKVRLLTSLPHINSPEDLAKVTDVEIDKINEVLKFLMEKGLVVYQSKKLEMGPSRTHVSKDSPFLKNHHRNWRLKSIERQSLDTSEDLFFTGPMTIEKKHYQEIKELLTKTLEKIFSTLEKTKAEGFYCLNMDFFEVIKNENIFLDTKHTDR